MEHLFRPDALAGKVAVVTGGGTGIGHAIAQAMARCGASLVLAGRRPDKLQEAAAALTELGADVCSVPTNVREPEQVQSLVDAAVGRFGQIDILVNSAGGQFTLDALSLTPNGWRSVVDLNLNATFFVCQAVARQMVRQGGGGAMINIVANTVERGCPGAAHSAAARAGVVNMAKSLALELSRHSIVVNNIAPGHFVTEGVRNSYGDPHFTEKMVARTPLRRAGALDELASLAVFLASPAASFITGQTIYADGGMALGQGLSLIEY